MKVLNVQNLDKSYKNGKVTVPAVSDVSLEVEKGEFVCVIGPNGCGKTSLLKIIAGILQPTAGTLKATPKTAYLPQKPSLLPWRTTLDNLLLLDDLSKKPAKSIKPAAQKLLKEFGLSEFADFYPGALSGGMQQKAALLRAVLASPRLMLLDEPFSSLDAITRRELQQWLLDLWQKTGAGVICVTHDINEAIFLADTIYVLGGRPGTIKKKITVKLPRPRRRSHLLSTEAKRLEIELNGLLAAK